MIISVTNMKGGIGKTTTICAIAAILSELGKKVLVVDMDPQTNTTTTFLPENTIIKNTICNVLEKEGDYLTQNDMMEYIIQKTDYDNIWLLPSHDRLNDLCNELIRDTSRNTVLLLRNALKKVEDAFDYILIDNTPFYNILPENSLAASDYVIAPIGTEGYSYEGLKVLLDRIFSIRDAYNKNLQFKGAFVACANIHTILFKDLFSQMEAEFGEYFIPVYIRRDNNVLESITSYIPLPIYNNKCNATIDYKKLVANLDILDSKTSNQLMKEIILLEAKQNVKMKKTKKR